MEDFEKSFDNAQDKFYNIALRFLSFRPRSEKEVRDKLLRLVKKTEKQKFSNSVVVGEESIIDSVVNKLKEQRFINDEEFAKWWIESRLRYRPRSLNLIKRELFQKGINREIIDAQISNFQFPISNELKNAQKLIEKKLPRLKGLPKEKIYEKLGRYLASKGFDWDTIKQSIDEVVLKGV